MMADTTESLLTAEQLRAVLAIVKEGSFTRAATKLGLKQPAITQQVRRLEERFGRKLFVRGPDGAALTVDGEALLIYARSMQKLGENLAQHFSAVQGPQPVRIGLNEDFGRRAFPAVLGMFARQNPTIQIKVVCGGADALFHDLDQGELDVVITRRHSERGRGELLWKDPTVWVGRADLVLPVSDPVALVLPPSGGLRTSILSALTENGRPWRVAFESWSLTSLEAALQAGLGISAFASEMMLVDLVRLDRASAGLPMLPASEFVYQQRVPPSSPVVGEFCAMLVEAARVSFSAEFYRQASRDERDIGPVTESCGLG